MKVNKEFYFGINQFKESEGKLYKIKDRIEIDFETEEDPFLICELQDNWIKQNEGNKIWHTKHRRLVIFELIDEKKDEIKGNENESK